jgi:bifunctional DNA-binding transcriptional regulator/antitoxin component of YhaV-PrlF toxin-antitoxin module
MGANVKLEDIKYATETTITIRGSRRRTTVPKEIVDHFGLGDGDRFMWILLNDGQLILSPRKAEVIVG